MTRWGRTLALLLIAVLALVLGEGSAGASSDLVKIRSIFRGPNDPSGAFVELQMYADGQNQLAGHNLNLWTFDMSGGVGITLQTDPGNGQNQRTALIRDAGSALPADYKVNNLGSFLTTNAAGGLACWETVDCVAWGNFSGSSPPSPVGTPIVGGLLWNMVSVRDIGRGCPTALDEADDTNDSNADFAFGVHPPRTNSDAPTETLCPTSTSNPAPAPATPKKKCKKRRKNPASAQSAKKKKCGKRGK